MSNGISHSYSSGTSLSRFSSEAIQGTEALKNDIRSSHKLSPPSQELPSTTSEGSSNLTESDKAGIGGKLKKDSESSENSSNGSHFHFSIYKWASKGVPLDMPIRGKSSSTRSKDKAKSEPFSGNGECVDKEASVASQSSETPLPNSSFNAHTFQKDNKPPNKLENDLPLDEVKADKVKPSEVSSPQSETLGSLQNPASKEPQKPEVKSIRSLLFDEDLERGKLC